MFKRPNRISFLVLVAAIVAIAAFRLTHIEKNEISWDVLGYYLPLPSTFIHDDLLLKDISWLQQINEQQQLSGTLYTISSNDQGEPMYVFLFGMALLFLPFFFIGHWSAALLGYEANGFTMPYQVALAAGAIIYTVIGLIYFRKILLHYFSDKIAAVLIVIIVAGTNYAHHLTLKNLETVNVLFMLMCIIVWNTIRWHEERKRKNLLFIAVSITLTALVKPSEIIIALIPILWNVRSLCDLRHNFRMLVADRTGFILAIAICVLMVLPQIAYWYTMTGKLVFDSYKNPGVGLDLTHPHIREVLFSFRKGWFIYTPVMIFSVAGYWFLKRRRPEIFWAVTVYTVLAFYILSSWTYWYYGAAFSCRPLITSYPLLAICFGYFLQWLYEKRKFWQLSFSLFVVLCIFLNQFQWWQLRNYILDPYRTTWKYYQAIFLKTSVEPGAEKYLSVFRDFSGGFNFTDRHNYFVEPLPVDSSAIIHAIVTDSTGNKHLHIKNHEEYFMSNSYVFDEMTDRDHAWIRVSMEVRFPDTFAHETPVLVRAMQYKQEDYNYAGVDIVPDTVKGNWQTFEAFYLTPEVRTESDRFKFYLWNRGKAEFDIRNLKAEIYQAKRPME